MLREAATVTTTKITKQTPLVIRGESPAGEILIDTLSFTALRSKVEEALRARWPLIAFAKCLTYSNIPYLLVRLICEGATMSMAKLTSKGQITLPITVRTALGVSAGDRVEFIEENGRFIVIPSTQEAKKLKGMIKRPTKPVTIEAMNDTIRKRGAGR